MLSLTPDILGRTEDLLNHIQCTPSKIKRDDCTTVDYQILIDNMQPNGALHDMIRYIKMPNNLPPNPAADAAISYAKTLFDQGAAPVVGIAAYILAQAYSAKNGKLSTGIEISWPLKGAPATVTTTSSAIPIDCIIRPTDVTNRGQIVEILTEVRKVVGSTALIQSYDSQDRSLGFFFYRVDLTDEEIIAIKLIAGVIDMISYSIGSNTSPRSIAWISSYRSDSIIHHSTQRPIPEISVLGIDIARETIYLMMLKAKQKPTLIWCRYHKSLIRLWLIRKGTMLFTNQLGKAKQYTF